MIERFERVWCDNKKTGARTGCGRGQCGVRVGSSGMATGRAIVSGTGSPSSKTMLRYGTLDIECPAMKCGKDGERGVGVERWTWIGSDSCDENEKGEEGGRRKPSLALGPRSTGSGCWAGDSI